MNRMTQLPAAIAPIPVEQEAALRAIAALDSGLLRHFEERLVVAPVLNQ